MLYKDKQLHIAAGFVVFVAAGFLFGPIMGLIAGCAAGVGKELFDRYVQDENFDVKDLLATVLGAGLGFVITHKLLDLI